MSPTSKRNVPWNPPYWSGLPKPNVREWCSSDWCRVMRVLRWGCSQIYIYEKSDIISYYRTNKYNYDLLISNLWGPESNPWPYWIGIRSSGVVQTPPLKLVSNDLIQRDQYSRCISVINNGPLWSSSVNPDNRGCIWPVLGSHWIWLLLVFPGNRVRW